MSTTHPTPQCECPTQATIETPRGNVRRGDVVECPDRIVGCRPVEHVRVEIEGHVLEVPEEDVLERHY